MEDGEMKNIATPVVGALNNAIATLDLEEARRSVRDRERAAIRRYIASRPQRGHVYVEYESEDGPAKAKTFDFGGMYTPSHVHRF